MQGRRKTTSDYIRDAIAAGITDNDGIKKYVKKRGRNASDCSISVIRSGNKSEKIVIPYLPYSDIKHRPALDKMFDKIKDWVNDDDRFLDLLLAQIKRIKK